MNFFIGLGGGLSVNLAFEKAKKELLRFLSVYHDKTPDFRYQFAKHRMGSSVRRLYEIQIKSFQEPYFSRLVPISETPSWFRQEPLIHQKIWLNQSTVTNDFSFRPLLIPATFQSAGTVIKAENTKLQLIDACVQPNINWQRILEVVGPTAKLHLSPHFIP